MTQILVVKDAVIVNTRHNRFRGSLVVAVKVANEAFKELSGATAVDDINDTLCSKR